MPPKMLSGNTKPCCCFYSHIKLLLPLLGKPSKQTLASHISQHQAGKEKPYSRMVCYCYADKCPQGAKLNLCNEGDWAFDAHCWRSQCLRAPCPIMCPFGGKEQQVYMSKSCVERPPGSAAGRTNENWSDSSRSKMGGSGQKPIRAHHTG